jgi:hypothetical protein
MAVVAALFLHAPILRCFASKLIVDESPGEFQWIGILESQNGPSGNRCYERAVQMQRERASAKILLVEPQSNRLVEIDVISSFGAVSRRILTSKGTPSDAIATTQRNGTDDWGTARALRNWLAERPNESMVVLCSSFRSAPLRYALDTVLGESSARVRVRALSGRQYNKSNWWKCRAGIRSFGIEWLRLLYGWCCGEEPSAEVGSADQYEHAIRKRCLDSMAEE